jgi:hypothetical protein
MSNKRFEKLLEPYHTGSVKTRNRIFKTGAGTHYWHESELHMTKTSMAFYEVYAIGDCSNPRLMVDAIADGWKKGNKI